MGSVLYPCAWLILQLANGGGVYAMILGASYTIWAKIVVHVDRSNSVTVDGR